jgi:hypothetical protein
MRTFKIKLNTDINRLKQLHMLKDKTEFKKLRAVIMEEHKISKSTLYREMNKEVPGQYAAPVYSFGPAVISAQEKELVKNLLFKKVTTMQIRRELQKLTGRNYSWDRFNQIRLAVEEDIRQQRADTAVSRPGDAVPCSDLLPVKKIGMAGADGDIPEIAPVSAFGDNLQLLLEAVFNFEKMSADTLIEVKYGEHIFRLGHDAVLDIKRILMNSASAEGRDVGGFSNMKIKHILAESLRNIENGAPCSVKDIAAIQRIYKSLEGMGSNLFEDKELEWIYRMVRAYNKDVTRELVMLQAINISRELFGEAKYHLFDLYELRDTLSLVVEEAM